ncbi:MAG: hypothetical protein K9G11_02120, partial [Rickettsiaceae bacterium]|nr:hypothetical protein [Rickettsiaceae bacterium]
ADEISSEIIQEMRNGSLEVQFMGVGGAKMLKQLNGRDSILDASKLSKQKSCNFFLKAFRNNRLVKNIANEILINNPDIFITIGSEYIACKIAKIISDNDLPTKLFHIALTSIKNNKIFSDSYYHVFLANMVDLITFERQSINNSFTGHPILRKKLKFTPQYCVNKHQCAIEDIILSLDLLHTSSAECLTKFALIAANLKKRIPKLKIAVLLTHDSFETNKKRFSQMQQIVQEFSVNDIIFETWKNRIDVYASSKVVLTTICDHNLEIAVTNTPFVATYEESLITKISRRIFKHDKYRSIVNKTISQELVLEFDQNENNTEIIVNNLYNIITEKQISKYYISSMSKILNLFTPDQDMAITDKICPMLYEAI